MIGRAFRRAICALSFVLAIANGAAVAAQSSPDAAAALGVAIQNRAVIGPHLTNPAGLRNFQAALANCRNQLVYFYIAGDSLTEGVGIEDSTNIISNENSDRYGWPGQLGDLFATYCNAPKAGVITAQFRGTDSRVQSPGAISLATTGTMSTGKSITQASFTGSISGNTLTVTAVAGGIIAIGMPVSGSGISGGPKIVSQTSGTTGGTGVYQLDSSPGTVASQAMTAVSSITFAAPASTQLELLVYQQQGGAPTTGTFACSIDGGAAASFVNSNDGYKKIVLGSGLAATAHSVTCAGTNGNVAMIFGLAYSSGRGVVVGRFAQGGRTLLDAVGNGYNTGNLGAAAQARMQALFGTWGASLWALAYGQNDGTYQFSYNSVTPQTLLSSVANFDALTRTIVAQDTAANVDTLLISNQLPPAQSPPAGGSSYMDYHVDWKTIASTSDRAAHIDIHDWMGSPAQSVAKGFHVNSSSVHMTIKGYANTAMIIFRELTKPNIYEPN
jgi:hypothetical protein